MINKIKTSLYKLSKNRRINVFFLFLALSFVILIFTKLSKNYTNTLEFNINKIKVPPQHIILSDSNSRLKITLKTHGFKWLKYYLEKPHVNIDFTKDVTNYKDHYTWYSTTSKLFLSDQLGDQVEIISTTPDSLAFNYDVNMVKLVPVKLKSEIRFKQGFNTDAPFKLKPDSIEVIGPHSLVSKINEIYTMPFKVKDLKSDLKKQIKLDFSKQDEIIKFSAKSTTLTGVVKKFTEGTLKIPITLVNAPQHAVIKFFPKTVTVKYNVSLDNFKNVNVNDFIVTCDFNNLEQGQTYLMPELVKSPKLVKYAKVNQKHIEFIILK